MHAIELDVVTHSCDPGAWWGKRHWDQELKATLSYIANLEQSQGIQDPV